MYRISSRLDGHQPTQDKRYKNGVSLSRQQLSKVQLESVTVEDSEIRVRNLEAWFDGHSCEQSAVRPSAIYISSDRSKSIYRKMLPSGSVLAHAFVTSRLVYCNYLLFGFQNTNVIGCRGFLAPAPTRIVCLVPKFSHHTPAFIIYIVYQCPSATSAIRPPSSRWYWPCLPKEVSKFQREWSLQFKI